MSNHNVIKMKATLRVLLFCHWYRNILIIHLQMAHLLLQLNDNVYIK